MPNLIENNFPFLSLINQLEDLVVCVSLEKKIITVNSSMENFLGCNKEKLQNASLETVLHDLHLEALTNNKISNLLSSLPITNLEYSCKHHDGSNHDISWSFSSLLDTNQIAKGLILVGRDITELKKLSLQVERLDNIIKYAPDMIYWKDLNSVHLGCNDQFAIVAGYEKRDDVIGKRDYDFPWHDQAKKYNLDDKEVIESGHPKLNIEDRMPFKSGKKAVVITNKVPLRDTRTGQVIGVLGIATDITPRKQLEEELRIAKEYAEAMNRTKTEFLANMSHDMKTPLTGIVGITESLVRHAKDQRMRKDLEQILDCGRHLMILFENCLELSKLENADVTLIIERFNFEELVNQVILLFKPAASYKELVLDVFYDDQIPECLAGSKAGIHRILQNLVGNAIKFTQRGSITIKVELAKKISRQEVLIKLVVEDTGIGIPHNKQKIIFERLTRLTPSYQGIYEGSGIGLYIVDKFIKAMGGEIYLESEEGKGSKFTVALPLHIPLLSENEKSYKPVRVLTPLKKKNRHLNSEKEALSTMINSQKKNTIKDHPYILLVEDTPFAQKAVNLLFTDLGCKVDIADCGKEAIAMFKPGKYDLVLMDLGLPDMKGYDVTRNLRETEKGTTFHVPILGLSAHATPEEKQLSSEAGMNEMLTKPLLFEPAKLLLKQYNILENIPSKLSIKAKENSQEIDLSAIGKSGLQIISSQKPTEKSTIDEQVGWMGLEHMLKSFPEIRAEIEKPYKAKDTKTLLAKVHKFHGKVLCSTNAPDLLHAVSTLANSLREGKINKIDALYQDLLHAMDDLEKVCFKIFSND